MSTLNLDILVVPTYNVMTLGIIDASTYPDSPPVVTNPTIEITPPGFNKVILTFTVNTLTIYNSDTLGITTDDLHSLPDGIYYFKYSISPAATNYVEKSIMRVDKLQEKFDEAFMKLDMMECDRAIKTQAKVNLNTIYFFIQGAMAAANNCAIDEASKLYLQAKKMLTYFVNNECGCSENNYLVNF
jgi:ribosome-associated translation inhibitor RaiA